MKKHNNLSIFVPHEGCPNKCSFCDQNKISGTQTPPTAQEVSRMCDEFLPTDTADGAKYEIAFFGGSFTAIDRGYMLSLLQAAYPFVRRGRAFGIRCSTRPDAIDREILSLLKEYGVTAIELGAQAMQDGVLRRNLRGHTAKDVYDASRLIKEYGFSLGLQMMTGLYGQDDYAAAATDTAKQFIKIHPDTVRIYPTLTLKDTLLETLYARGAYTPPSLDETVEICKTLVKMFEDENIKIIKLGLHSDAGMEKSLVAGPYHPAFRELVESAAFLDRVKQSLENSDKGKYELFVNKRRRSIAVGQKRKNINRLSAAGYTVTVREDEKLTGTNYYIKGKQGVLKSH
ncbi:MAG: radical SAM protein [Oscillospiraceae bacterium]|nr:radical SAM protein [Oscillospiraceae bacterium]